MCGLRSDPASQDRFWPGRCSRSVWNAWPAVGAESPERKAPADFAHKKSPLSQAPLDFARLQSLLPLARRGTEVPSLRGSAPPRARYRRQRPPLLHRDRQDCQRPPTARSPKRTPPVAPLLPLGRRPDRLPSQPARPSLHARHRTRRQCPDRRPPAELSAYLATLPPPTLPISHK